MAGKGTVTIKILGDANSLNRTLASTGGMLSNFGKMAGVAFAAVGVAAVAAGAGIAAFAFKSAKDIDKAMDTIRTGTGATGKSLEDLGKSFETVFKNVPASAETVGQAIADLNTRTGATGEALEKLATQSVRLAQITGEDLGGQIAATTRVFGDWSIASDKQSDAMDYLFKVSQSTGIGVTELSEKVVQFGAPLRQLGFDFETSAALMGKWEKEGVNLETVLAGMKIGLANFAKAGKDPKEALIAITKEIKNAGTQAEANKKAIEIFGQRAGPDMAAAIREGRFELDELLTLLEESPETIMAAAEATDDFGEKWARVKNKLAIALEPLGSLIMDKLSALADLVEQYMPQIESAFSTFFAVITGGAPGVGTALGSIGTVIAAVRDIFTAAWSLMGQAVQMFIDWLSGSEGQAFISTLLDGIGTVMAGVQTVFEAVWPAIQDIIQMFIDFFAGPTGQAIITGLTSAIGTVLEILAEVFDKVWPVIQSVVQTFIDFWNGPMGQKIITTLLDGVGVVLGVVRDIFNAAWPIIQSAVKTFVDWFNGPDGQKVIKTLVDLLGVAIATLRSVWEAAWPAIKQALELAKPVIMATLGAIAGAVKIVADAISKLIALYKTLQGLGSIQRSGGTGANPAIPDYLRGRAAGGFVTSPEISLIGEAGPELVLPLTNPKRTAQLLAQAGMGGLSSLGGVVINIYGQGAQAGEAAGDAFLKRLTTAGVTL